MKQTKQTKTLKYSSYLIQRVKKPHSTESNHRLNQLDNSFSFGGGLKNGGLSEEAMSLIRPIMRFDYMGAAEFEWGAVPKFFQNVAKNIGNYSSWQIDVNGFAVYVVGQTDLAEEINTRIDEIAKPFELKLYFKEQPLFNRAVTKKTHKEENFDIVGWLELDNEFMFFVDEEMFNKVVNLFELKFN